MIPGTDSPGLADDPVTIGTYHAFAGNLLREYGLLLPVEPDTRLLGETELWQLAFRVVCEHPDALDTEKSPASITAMVLRLAGQLSEHLVDTDQLRDTHLELERLVHTLPGRAVSARQRSEPVAAADAGHPDRTHRTGPADRCAAPAHARGAGHRLRHADGVGGSAGVTLPASRASSCGSATGWCCSTSTRTPGTPSGSRCRRCSAAASTTGWRSPPSVTRSSRSTDGAGASATNLPRFTTDFPLVRRHPGTHPGTAHQLAQPAGGAAPGQRGRPTDARRRSVAVRVAAAPARCRSGQRALRAAARRGGRTRMGGRRRWRSAITTA